MIGNPKNVFIILFFILCTQLLGQEGQHKVFKSKLHIVLNDSVIGYNEMVRQVFPEEWKHMEYDFITQKEYEEYKTGKEEGYKNSFLQLQKFGWGREHHLRKMGTTNDYYVNRSYQTSEKLDLYTLLLGFKGEMSLLGNDKLAFFHPMKTVYDQDSSCICEIPNKQTFMIAIRHMDSFFRI